MTYLSWVGLEGIKNRFAVRLFERCGLGIVSLSSLYVCVEVYLTVNLIDATRPCVLRYTWHPPHPKCQMLGRCQYLHLLSSVAHDTIVSVL